jgi:hypothetical protein
MVMAPAVAAFTLVQRCRCFAALQSVPTHLLQVAR